MVSNNRYLKPIIIALCFIVVFCTLACCGVQPLRPWFSETPRERHIEDGDRLMASYFNGQLNVIYSWAQRINAEIDNLMHNGVGIASLTVDIINCTGKIVNPEIDNLLRNGIGVASITADEATVKRLSVTEKTVTAALAMPARNQPPQPDGNPQIYYDSSLDRFRIFQEGGWRDLSPNVFISSDSLSSPLVLQGYLQATNIYASNSVIVKDSLSVGKELNAGEKMNVNGLATFTKGLSIGNGVEPAVLDATRGVTRLGNLDVNGFSAFNAFSRFNSAAKFFSNATVEGNLAVEGNANFNKALRIPKVQNNSYGEGSICYDAADKKIKFFNGASWKNVGETVSDTKAYVTRHTVAGLNSTWNISLWSDGYTELYTKRIIEPNQQEVQFQIPNDVCFPNNNFQVQATLEMYSGDLGTAAHTLYVFKNASDSGLFKVRVFKYPGGAIDRDIVINVFVYGYRQTEP